MRSAVFAWANDLGSGVLPVPGLLTCGAIVVLEEPVTGRRDVDDEILFAVEEFDDRLRAD